jgi:hypothetical protein
MKSLLRNFAVVAIVLAACSTAHAQTSWNVASGNWNTAGNWNPTTVPVSGDASISNSGTATLNTNSTGLASLTIGSGSVLEKDNTVTARSITMSTTALSGLITNSGTIRYGQATGPGTFTITSGPAGWNNSGLITTSAAGQTLALVAGGTITVTNSGTVRADGGILNLNQSNTGQTFSITNSGGLLRATNGGTLSMNSGVTITGGSLSIDAGSFFRVNRTNTTTALTNVTVTNAGTMLSQSSSQNFILNFNGTTALTNTGTLEYLTSGTGTPSANGSAASTATITNESTGIIRVANNNTAGTATAFFTNSTANFTNLGGIEIKSNGALTSGSSQFRSTAVNFSNAGSFLVDGPVSSIVMTGRTFTQTAGSLSLINGGSMAASSVLINSGTLLGTGTINAPVTVGGIVAPGNAGIGTLSVSNGVTWNAGNAWLFQLGAPAVSLAAATSSSDADLLSLTGAFTQGTGSTFTFDFAAGGSDGWYKLVDYTSTNFTPGTNTSFAATNVPAGKSANFVVDAGSTALYVQIVPEPSALALAGLGIGLAGLIASRRRRG